MRVDLNPLQAGGTADPTSASGWKKAVMYAVSFVAFFVLVAVGQEGAQRVLSWASQTLGIETQQSGPSITVH